MRLESATSDELSAQAETIRFSNDGVHRGIWFGLPERLAGFSGMLPYAVLSGIALGLYARTLYFGFVYDDNTYILNNLQIHGITWSHWRELWTTPYLFNYAPVHNLAMAVLYSIAGPNPFPFHLAQVVLHAANVCVLYFVLSRIESRAIAFLASLLFAVYPANIETVAWVSELKSTLALLFFLFSFFFYARLGRSGSARDGIWCGVFLSLSLLSKVSTIVAPCLFLIYDYAQGSLSKQKIRTLFALSAIAGIFVVIHMKSAGLMSRSAPSLLIDQAIADFTVPASSLTHAYYFGGLRVHLINLPTLLLFYVRMAFFPYPVSVWHMVPIYAGLNWKLGISWLLLIGWLWILFRSPRVYQFWQLWFLVFLLPVLQIVPNPAWVADRYLYIPAIGFFVLVAKLVLDFLDRPGAPLIRHAVESACLLLVLAFGFLANRQIPAWRDNLSLWTNALKTCMPSAYCHHNVANALAEQGEDQLAVEEYRKAILIRPSASYLVSLGDTYSRLGDYRQALDTYHRAERAGEPLNIRVLASMAKAYFGIGDLSQAGLVIEQGLQMNPSNPWVLTAKAILAWKRGNVTDARIALLAVLRSNAEDPQTARPQEFFTFIWRDQTEIARMLRDVGPL